MKTSLWLLLAVTCMTSSTFAQVGSTVAVALEPDGDETSAKTSDDTPTHDAAVETTAMEQAAGAVPNANPIAEESATGKQEEEPEEAFPLVSVKPGKGIAVQSRDGAFLLRIRPRIQLRYEGARSTDNTFTQVFMVRRARLALTGHLFTRETTFSIELAVSPRDMGFKDGRVTNTPITDIYVQSGHLRDLSLRGGQMKVPYSRQRVVSSGNLQMVDRSLAQGEFNLDRDVGVFAFSRDLFGLKLLRYSAGLFVGEGRDVYQLADFGMLYVGRVEILPLSILTGEIVNDSAETDLSRSKKPRLTIGLAYAFLDEAKKNRGILGKTPTDGGTTDTHNLTADIAAKWMGFSLFVEAFGRFGFRNPGTATDANGIPLPVETPQQGVGGTVQAAYLLPFADVEVSARFSGVRGVFETSLVDTDEVGAGVSYYLAGHSLKLQADVFQRFSDFDVTTGSSQVRAQLQAAF